jgi:methionyl-tRNA formyltransferase
MRILFLGTPAYALTSLQRLAALHQIVGVVSQPDRHSGRRGHLQSPPVAVFAREQGIPLLQPENLRNPEFRAQIENLRADLGVVIAYGHIMPRWLIEAPTLGIINAHGSLLPRFRGAAPIQRAILSGDTQTGVTVQQVVFEMDAGPILLKEPTEILPGETSGQLFTRMQELSVVALERAVELIDSGKAVFSPQDPAAVCFAPKITREEGIIDWSRSALFLERAARAFNPWPALHTRMPGGKGLKILAARAESGDPGAPPGTVLEHHEELPVATGEGLLYLTRVQAEGRRAMAVRDFLHGKPIKSGDRLTSC